MKCPYCGSKAKLVDSKVIYGRSYGKAFICSNYPCCDSYVGCHKGTDIPLGTLANSELRKKRNQCHVLFDQTWKSNNMTRIGAYARLAKLLNIRVNDCHFGMFDLNTCNKAMKFIYEFMLNNKMEEV